jgi:hypothetical protein
MRLDRGLSGWGVSRDLDTDQGSRYVEEKKSLDLVMVDVNVEATAATFA